MKRLFFALFLLLCSAGVWAQVDPCKAIPELLSGVQQKYIDRGDLDRALSSLRDIRKEPDFRGCSNLRLIDEKIKYVEGLIRQRNSKPLTFTVKDVSFTMVPVPGGTFTMGATSEQGSDADDDEKATHKVTLSFYYIGRYEVTQALWEAVMDAHSFSSSSGKPNNPVTWVSWEDCQKFVSKLNSLTSGQRPTGHEFHLPTEAEWEYAARGGKSGGTKYSGSNDIEAVAWYTNNSGSATHPVGEKKANGLGLYDMSGNVWEWCQDSFDSYSLSDQTNPRPSTGFRRVYRGGSWNQTPRDCRVSERGGITPGIVANDLGLRLAL